MYCHLVVLSFFLWSAALFRLTSDILLRTRTEAAASELLRFLRLK